MVLINMSDEPEPVILTGVQNATLEISEDNDSNPGNNDFGWFLWMGCSCWF